MKELCYCVTAKSDLFSGCKRVSSDIVGIMPAYQSDLNDALEVGIIQRTICTLAYINNHTVPIPR